MECNVACIIKLGGSAITRKTEMETAIPESIARAADIVAGMRARCIVVHGAGSYGHFQASSFKVASGYRNLPSEQQEKVKEGFCKTRLSVTKLNHMVVEEFVERGIRAVGVAPCSQWRTRDRSNVVQSGCDHIASLLDQGFIPVLHGDCVTDETLGCTILSGDTIIRVLCEHFKPSRVVFLSDVDGIFTKPPSDTNAQLIPTIRVNQDGSIATSIATSNLDHDVTGGIRTKIASACAIVLNSHGDIPVFICRLEGESAKLACWKGDRSRDFKGTIVQAS